MFTLEAAARTIAEVAKQGAIIVENSTVPCRTVSRIRDVVSYPLSFECLIYVR